MAVTLSGCGVNVDVGVAVEWVLAATKAGIVVRTCVGALRRMGRRMMPFCTWFLDSPAGASAGTSGRGMGLGAGDASATVARRRESARRRILGLG